MENQLHAQFSRMKSKLSMADLSQLQQKPRESTKQFITCFNQVRNKCHILILEHEFVKLSQVGLYFELQKKFKGDGVHRIIWTLD